MPAGAVPPCAPPRLNGCGVGVSRPVSVNGWIREDPLLPRASPAGYHSETQQSAAHETERRRLGDHGIDASLNRRLSRRGAGIGRDDRRWICLGEDCRAEIAGGCIVQARPELHRRPGELKVADVAPDDPTARAASEHPGSDVGQVGDDQVERESAESRARRADCFRRTGEADESEVA